MGPFRSCWKSTTSALQPEEIILKGVEFHVCTINKSVYTKKVWELVCPCTFGVMKKTIAKATVTPGDL